MPPPPTKSELCPKKVGEYFKALREEFHALNAKGYAEDSIFGSAAEVLLGSNTRGNRKALYMFCRRNKVLRTLLLSGVDSSPAHRDDTISPCGQSFDAAEGDEHEQVESHSPISADNSLEEVTVTPKSKVILTQTVVSARVVEGNFYLPYTEWSEIFKDGNLVKGKWTNVLAKYFAKVNAVCVLLIRDQRHTSFGLISVRGYCKHRDCKRFFIDIHKPVDGSHLDVEVTVASVGKENHGNDKFARPLRGSDREEVKEILLKDKPVHYRSRTILVANESAVIRGNLHNIHSLDVLRHARQEGRASGDCHKDPVYDIIEMYLKEKDEPEQYVQYVALPLGVYCFSKSQVMALASVGDGVKEACWSGATITDILRLIYRLCDSSSSHHKFILCVGANDISRGDDAKKIRGRIHHMMRHMIKHQARVILVGVPPNPNLKGKEKRAEAAIRRYCKGWERNRALAVLASSRVRGVVGIESVYSAVRDALAHVITNGCSNVEIIPGLAEKKLPRVAEELDSAPDIVAVINPGRGGVGHQVIQAVRECNRIERVVYVSCDAEGAAVKNFVQLCAPSEHKKKLSTIGGGSAPFSLTRAVQMDIFPHTANCDMVL